MKQKYLYLFLSLVFAGFGYSQQATHLNFDGNDDLLNCGNNSSVQISGNQITLEAWVRAESFRTNVWEGTIINKEQNSPDYGYMLRVGASGQVNFNIGNGTWHEITTPSNTLSTNTWYHLAATYNGTTMIIYVNGVMVTSSTAFSGNFTNSNVDLCIGNMPNLSRGFDGDIDEVRVWNVARSQSEISSNMDCVANNTTGLVAYYKFNQGVASGNNSSITSVFDATANNNNGMLTNLALNGASSNWLNGSDVATLDMPTATSPVIYQIGATASPLTATSGASGLLWYTAANGGIGSTTAPTPSTSTIGDTSYWVSSTNANSCESERKEIVVRITPIPPGSHLHFDGSNDFISCGNILPNSYTKEAWIYLSDLSSINNIISGGGTDGKHAFWAPSIWGNKLSAGHNDVFDQVQDPTPLNANTWYHVAVTYNAATTTMNLYKDGVLVATNNAVPPFINGNAVRLGAYDNGTYILHGNMDEVRIWNVVKTETEISNSKDCELMGNETGLVAYYQFNEGIDQANNATVTTLPDVTSNGYNGTLNNFALNGATSNWLAGSAIFTPEAPVVTSPVVYNEGDTASPLSATSGATGLMWYTTSTGGTGSTTAPTPDTAILGDTSYWVSSTNANGCESEREEIVVTVNELTNDTCANALPLTVGTVFSDFPENVDLTGATDSGVFSLWCGDYQGGDRWYTAVIPSSGNLIIETNGGTYYDTVLEIFAGSDCNDLFDIQCDDNSGTDDYSKITFNGAPGGETIYIRVYEYGTASSTAQFQISVYEPYYNICADTTPLSVGTIFADFPENVDLTGATDSGVEQPWCANYQGGDKWFAVTIPASGNLFIETAGLNGDDTGLAVYLGDCDNDLNLYDCNDDFNNGYSLLELNGLPAFETLYVRVWENGVANSVAQFQIAAYDDTPPYDICSSTTPLTVGTTFSDFPEAVDLTGATDSGVPNPGCASYIGGDQWFTAVVPASGNIIIETNSSNPGDTGLAVYNGNCNNALTILNCDDDGSGNFNYSLLEFTNLTPGETLYIRVWQYNNDTPTIQFEVSAYDTTGPYNICSSTNALTVGGVFSDFPASVDLTGAAGSNVSDPGCASYDGGELWFTAVVPASGSLTIETDSSNSGDTGIAVYNGNCNNALVLIDCDDDGSGNYNYSLLELTSLTPGETLYIRVWEYGNDTSTLQFELSAYDASLANESFTSNSIMIYPNPSNGLLTINTPESIKVEAWDVLGKLILSSDLEAGSNKIDISNHAAGIYIFKATSANGESKIYKVIKE